MAEECEADCLSVWTLFSNPIQVRCKVNIPDTVLFTGSAIATWFYTEASDGLICTRLLKVHSWFNLYQALLQMAGLDPHDTPSHAPLEEQPVAVERGPNGDISAVLNPCRLEARLKQLAGHDPNGDPNSEALLSPRQPPSIDSPVLIQAYIRPSDNVRMVACLAETPGLAAFEAFTKPIPQCVVAVTNARAVQDSDSDDDIPSAGADELAQSSVSIKAPVARELMALCKKIRHYQQKAHGLKVTVLRAEFILDDNGVVWLCSLLGRDPNLEASIAVQAGLSGGASNSADLVHKHIKPLARSDAGHQWASRARERLERAALAASQPGWCPASHTASRSRSSNPLASSELSRFMSDSPCSFPLKPHRSSTAQSRRSSRCSSSASTRPSAAVASHTTDRPCRSKLTSRLVKQQLALLEEVALKEEALEDARRQKASAEKHGEYLRSELRQLKAAEELARVMLLKLQRSISARRKQVEAESAELLFKISELTAEVAQARAHKLAMEAKLDPAAMKKLAKKRDVLAEQLQRQLDMITQLEAKKQKQSLEFSSCLGDMEEDQMMANALQAENSFLTKHLDARKEFLGTWYELDILELICTDKAPAESELLIRQMISLNDTALRKTFVRYRDPKLGTMLMTGFQKFCADAQVTAGARCTPKGVEEVFHKAMHHSTDQHELAPSMRYDEFVESILRISVKRFAEYVNISAVEKLNMFMTSNFLLTPIGSALATEDVVLPGTQALPLVTIC